MSPHRSVHDSCTNLEILCAEKVYMDVKECTGACTWFKLGVEISRCRCNRFQRFCSTCLQTISGHAKKIMQTYLCMRTYTETVHVETYTLTGRASRLSVALAIENNAFFPSGNAGGKLVHAALMIFVVPCVEKTLATLHTHVTQCRTKTHRVTHTNRFAQKVLRKQ